METRVREEVQKIAWDREGLVSPHDFMNRYSKQHVCKVNADYTLCGARIRWMYLSPGDSTRCERCYELASKRGYVDEWGDPFSPRVP